MIGVCEALLYAYKAGLDLDTADAERRQRGGRARGASPTWGPG